MLFDVDVTDSFEGPCYYSVEEKREAQASMKIGILRALPLGDMLCIIPAMRALRNCYPGAHITLFGLPWAKELVSRFPFYFDSFKHFPGYPGLPEQGFEAEPTLKFIAEVQEEKFDLILQMQDNGTMVNSLIMMLGAKYCAGYCSEGHYYPNNDLFLPYPDHLHEIEKHIALLRNIGIEPAGTELEFPLYEKDWAEFRKLNLALSYKEYVCIHSDARNAGKHWSPGFLAGVANYFAGRNLKVVFTGTEAGIPFIHSVSELMATEPIILAGKTSLGCLGALLKNAFALISASCGVSYMAAAFKTPSIYIHTGGDPEICAPIRNELHKTIDFAETRDLSFVMQEVENLFTWESRKAA